MKQLVKVVSFIAVFALFTATSQAQNAIAKIKYEQAEEAFAKEDYAVTLVKLDEAQKLLGSTNPKILYLRLMAAKGIVATGKFDWNFLETARKDAAYYIRQYSEMQGIEEKFRQVYEFSETLDALPKTKTLWDEKQAQAAQAYNEWLKQRPVQVSDSLMNAFKVTKSASLQELSTYNPAAFASLKKAKIPSKIVKIAYSSTLSSEPGPSEVWFDDKGLFMYSYIVVGLTKDTAMAKNRFRSLVDLYPAGLQNESIIKTEFTTDAAGNESGALTIGNAATGNKGIILIMYFCSWQGAHVEISFTPR